MTTAATEQDAAAPERGTVSRRALDSLPTRARTTGSQAAARSRLVRRLRIGLPILGLVLVAAFFFNTTSEENDSAFLQDFEDVRATAEELRMASPRFSGIDTKGKPFEITAAAAIQNPQVKDVVQLENPKAVQGDAGETNIVTAQNGVYRSDAKILELNDDVTLEHDVGADTYIFRSASATVSIDDEVVTSDAGIGGEGPAGETLQADRMKAYNNEGRVVLEGNVRMRLYPKSKEKPAAQNNETPPLKDVQINNTPQRN
ncbi:LPS export ABC transporter periplasmic protein LptC [Hyphococcus sp.]|uniref:LPS export ABC transporter periplasmic protein LptC n=1 Tax=Hyphococcus sp. TaxID=2038636 RepID=UPI003CCBC789